MSLELLKKKMLFPSRFVRLQTLDQLSSAIQSKDAKNSSSELEVLWKFCSDPDSEDLGYMCADTIVMLVKNRVLTYDDVIMTSVNLATAVKKARPLIHAIASLIESKVLDHFKKSPDARFQSPYNFRECPHPFISILNSAPHLWNVVDDQTSLMLLNCTDSSLPALLVALRPAIIYISLKSNNSAVEMSRSVPSILKTLLQKYRSSSANSDEGKSVIENLLYHIFDYYEPTAENIIHFEEFALLGIEDRPAENSFNTQYLLKLQDCIIKNFSTHGSCLASQSMNRIIELQSEININSDIIAVGFSLVLCHASIQIIPNVLTTVIVFLERYHLKVHPVHLHMLKTSVLKLKFLSTAIPNGHVTLLQLNKLFRIITTAMAQAKELSCQHIDMFIVNPSSNAFISKTCFLNHVMNEILTKNNEFSRSWLDGLEKSATEKSLKGGDVHDATVLLSTFLLYGLDNRRNFNNTIFKKVLAGIRRIGESFPEASFNLLPVMLYSLESTDGAMSIDVLLSLPHLASHPNCISPVLNIIKGIASGSDCNLKGLSVRMMMELWKVQNRCFPYLLDALYTSEVQTIKRFSSDNNTKVIKAAAIAFVCKERPHQHCSDMLKLVEVMLSKKLPCDALAYVLEGLYYLCLNKALKLVTIVDRLISILQNSFEFIVFKVLLKTFALLSSIDTSESVQEELLDNALEEIWKLTVSGKPNIADEALGCLSHFDPTVFKMKHLPSILWTARSDDISEDDFLDTVVPYSHHLTITIKLDCTGLPGCSRFITSILRHEVENLPRSIHHTAIKSQLASTQPRAAKSIPDFVTTAYERNKRPGLKAPLAFSMLLSQSSPVATTSQNNSEKKLAVTAGRKCMDSIQVMLKEVIIDPNNWQDLIRCAQGWVAFMKKSLAIMTAGRRAETEMQKFEDTEEKEHRLNTSALWCRDKIVNALKSASKNSPSMQGNAVLGLAGLLLATEQFTNDHDKVTDHTEYVSTNHWAHMVLETIVSIAFPSHIPYGRLLSWCQYKAISSTGRLCTTQVGRMCAIHALPLCLSSSAQGKHRKVKDIISFLGEEIDNDKQLNFHRQISFGNAISVLTKELSEAQTTLALSEFSLEEAYKSLREKVESFVASPSDLEYNLGSIIGWALSATLRFSQSAQMCEKEKALWLNLFQILLSCDTSPETSQTVSLVLSWLCLHGLARGILSTVDGKELLNYLVDAAYEIPSKTGYCGALGTLCCGLFLNGNKDIATVMDKLYTKWFGILEKGNAPTREKHAALTGLSSLCGAGGSLFSLPVDPALLTSVQYVSKLSGTVKLLKQLHSSSDVVMQSRSSIYLGCLNLFFENNLHNSSFILPSTYGYLSRSSLLNEVFSVLVDIGGQRSDVSKRYIEMLLQCIAETCKDIILPPVNWGNALNLILLNNMWNSRTRFFAVNIVLTQCERSSPCSALLCKCISPNIFAKLPVSLSVSICKNLKKVYKSAKEPEFIMFLNQIVQNVCATHSDFHLPVKTAFMDGLKELVTASNELSSPALETIRQCLVKIFFDYQFSIYCSNDLVFMDHLSTCFKRCNMTLNTFINANMESDIALKSLYISCCLSSRHGQPSSMFAKLILACADHPSTYDQAIWISVMYSSHMRQYINSVTLCEWVKELLKMTEDQICKTKETLEHLVCVVLSIFSSIYFGNYLGKSNAPTPEMMISIKAMCRRTFPTALHGLLLKPSFQGINESIVHWCTCMVEKFRECRCTSCWADSLITAIGQYKELEANLLPSVWCNIISTIYPEE